MTASAPEIVPNYVPEDKRPTSVRFGVLALLALAATSSYLTRICLSTANTTIQRDFGISNEQMGDILAAFFVGYLWFQLPTGWLGARYGGRRTLAGLNVLASACSVWSGLAAGPVGLWFSRLGLGVAQAGLVPCVSRAIVDWFPAGRRGTASSMIASSMSLGAVIASGLTAVLLPFLGWRGVFFAYSTVGLVWAAGYYAWFRDRPEEHPAVNPAERRLIRGGETGVSEGAPAPDSPTSRERFRATRALLGAMVSSSSAWLLCGQALFRAFGMAFFLTWFPAFLEKGHGVRLEDTGFLAMLPLTGSVLGALAGGAVVDAVLARSGSRRLSRSGTATGAMLMSGLCILGATVASGPLALVLILSLGAFCFGVGSPASWAAAMDVSGKHTQVVFAIQNMCGNVGAMLSPKIVGWLFDRIEAGHGTWDQVLYLFVGISLAGALCWVFLNPNRSAVGAKVEG